jgi:hypothetical protein
MDTYQIERLRVIADVLGKAAEQADKAAVEHILEKQINELRNILIKNNLS